MVKEAKSGQVQSLRQQIRKLKKEVERLKSELRTYDKVFKENEKFLKDGTKGLSVEELIEAANNEQTLKQTKAKKRAKPACPKCFSKSYAVIKTGFGESRSCADCSYREKVMK